MTSSDDIEAWDRAASAYSTVVGTRADSIYQRFEGFLWHHLDENLDGLRLLDLGCGHGWLAELCRTKGATVTAVDGSDELLGIARSRYPEVYFQQGDLTEGLPEAWAAQTFDRVVAHMVLMDLPHLDALASSLGPCVSRDGVVVVTLPHPSFFLQAPVEDRDSGERYRKVKGYLEHEEWWIETFGGHRHYHRPLEFYVRWFASAGLAVVDLHEPPVPLAKPQDDWTDYDRWFSTLPTMLGIAARPWGPS